MATTIRQYTNYKIKSHRIILLHPKQPFQTNIHQENNKTNLYYFYLSQNQDVLVTLYQSNKQKIERRRIRNFRVSNEGFG